MIKSVLNTKKLSEQSTIRELTPTEIQNVSGAWGVWGYYDSQTGFHGGAYLGKHPGRG